MFGYRDDEIVGRSPQLLAPPENAGRNPGKTSMRPQQRQLSKNVETQRLQGRQGGGCRASAAPGGPASNEVIGEICSMRDITGTNWHSGPSASWSRTATHALIQND